MRNLIGLFFLVGTLSTQAQETKKDIVTETKPIVLEAETVAQEIAQNKPVSEKTTVPTTEVAENEPNETIVDTKPQEKVKTAAKLAKTTAVGTVKADIISGFKNAKADQLAKYFPANIDISILEKSNLYSKSQAKQVLTTFFTQNKPTSFVVVHEGESNGTQYFIGSYVSGGEKYRVTVNVNKVEGKDQISSISIER